MREIQVLMQWGWAFRSDGLCSRCKVRPHKVATEAKPSTGALCPECMAAVAEEFWATYN